MNSVTINDIHEIYDRILEIEYVNGIVWATDSIGLIVASYNSEYRYESVPMTKKEWEVYFKLIESLIE